MIEYDSRRRSDVLGDDEYSYGPPQYLRRAPRDVKMEDTAPPEAKEQLVGVMTSRARRTETTPTTTSASFNMRRRGTGRRAGWTNSLHS
jgi:hypothetical protein